MKNTLGEAILYVVLFVVLAPLMIIPLLIYSGWAISTSWNWLMVPIFGIRELTIYQGIAVSLIVGYLTHQLQDKNSDDNLQSFGWILARPLMLVGFAWILKGYI